MMQKKNYVKNCIAVALAMMLLAGCGSQAETTATSEEIVLQEPVGISANYDVAQYRDLYNYELYPSVVAPYVTEYAFEKDHVFKEYAIAPGATAEPGDALVYSETRDIDKQVEELDEEIEDLKTDHLTDVDAMQKDIKDAKDAEYKAAEGVAAFYEWEPDESNQAAHDGFDKMILKPQIAYKRAIQGRERLEQALKEINEMYDLELAYKEDTKKRLQDKVTDATIQAKEKGTVVACSLLLGGETVGKEIPIMALGDTETKVIRTTYITKTVIAKAEDYYAFINGKRYEVNYQPIENEEYNRLTQDGQTVYSSFYLQDPNNEVAMGDAATLVLINESRSDVLCIPYDAVKVEKEGSYCYVYDGENSVYTELQLGLKDGAYVEVLSGIKPGDKVLSAEGAALQKNRATLEKGTFENQYESNGFLYYPFSWWIENPVETGKAYIKEILVTESQQVKTGETLMTLEVVSDDIEIERCKKRIERLEERLVKLQAKKTENDGRKIIDRQVEKNITANIAETNRVKRTLAKLSKYSGTVEIQAPKDGIITEISELKPGDMVWGGTKLLQFADSSVRAIVVNDKDAVLAYGNQATVEYVDVNGARQSVPGEVITVDNSALSKDLKKDWMLISLPEESQQLFDGSREDGGKWSRDLFTVKIPVRQVQDVVLVPKQAVSAVKGSFYVNVVQEDGTVTKTGFISGGSNNNYHWAICGLDEGMEICWE